MATGTLGRLFSHPKNKINLFEAMNKGSLILINTAKEYLKREQCEIFGRFMIALIAQATQERANLPAHLRRPTFVYLDEAQDYFGDEGVGIGELLNQGRKYRVGLTLAFQNLAQLDRKLQASIMASTAIKFAGGVSADEHIPWRKKCIARLNSSKTLKRWGMGRSMPSISAIKRQRQTA
jgi:hypothetical protein